MLTKCEVVGCLCVYVCLSVCLCLCCVCLCVWKKAVHSKIGLPSSLKYSAQWFYTFCSLRGFEKNFRLFFASFFESSFQALNSFVVFYILFFEFSLMFWLSLIIFWEDIFGMLWSFLALFDTLLHFWADIFAFSTILGVPIRSFKKCIIFPLPLDREISDFRGCSFRGGEGWWYSHTTSTESWDYPSMNMHTPLALTRTAVRCTMCVCVFVCLFGTPNWPHIKYIRGIAEGWEVTPFG